MLYSRAASINWRELNKRIMDTECFGPPDPGKPIQPMSLRRTSVICFNRFYGNRRRRYPIPFTTRPPIPTTRPSHFVPSISAPGQQRWVRQRTVLVKPGRSSIRSRFSPRPAATQFRRHCRTRGIRLTCSAPAPRHRHASLTPCGMRPPLL